MRATTDGGIRVLSYRATKERDDCTSWKNGLAELRFAFLAVLTSWIATVKVDLRGTGISAINFYEKADGGRTKNWRVPLITTVDTCQC